MEKRLLVKNQGSILSELSSEIPANGIITVGNDPSATIELKDGSVAPEQFVIVCEPEQMTLMCRANGTVINGQNVSQGTIHNLQSGDVITLGNYVFALETNGKVDPETPEKLTYSAPDSFEIAENSANSGEKNGRTLTDILAGLRAEEKFYFQVEEKNGENQRVYVETEEMWLGWSVSGECVLTAENSEIANPRAQIRKDWSGVVVYPQHAGSVRLNNEILTEPHRLKNDDQLFLQAKDSAKFSLENVIKFHEPTALLVLDSILPKELPPPILLDKEGSLGNDENFVDEKDLHSSQIPSKLKKAKKRMIFGYFTIAEILIMTTGTLITAGIIFLILELY